MFERTVVAAGVASVKAPPEMLLPQLRQVQMPVTLRFMLSVPQKTQWYLACWEISIFLSTFLMLAP